MAHRKKLVNNSGIPQHEIEYIAQCILPDIIAFYESEEGQREFQEWKAQRDAEAAERKAVKVEVTRKKGCHQSVAPHLITKSALSFRKAAYAVLSADYHGSDRRTSVYTRSSGEAFPENLSNGHGHRNLG